MKLPPNWREVRSADGLLEYYQRDCGGYRVLPMYTNRWHACERLMPDGTWLEWAGKEHLRDAMAVCGRHAKDHLGTPTQFQHSAASAAGE